MVPYFFPHVFRLLLFGHRETSKHNLLKRASPQGCLAPVWRLPSVWRLFGALARLAQSFGAFGAFGAKANRLAPGHVSAGNALSKFCLAPVWNLPSVWRLFGSWAPLAPFGARPRLQWEHNCFQCIASTASNSLWDPDVFLLGHTAGIWDPQLRVPSF